MAATPLHFRCNTCQGVYFDTEQDGLAYFHACPDIQTPSSQPNPALPGFIFPIATPRPNKRDENFQPGLITKGGVVFILQPNPLDPLSPILVPVPSPINSAGLGRTQI